MNFFEMVFRRKIVPNKTAEEVNSMLATFETTLESEKRTDELFGLINSVCLYYSHYHLDNNTNMYYQKLDLLAKIFKKIYENSLDTLYDLEALRGMVAKYQIQNHQEMINILSDIDRSIEEIKKSRNQEI